MGACSGDSGSAANDGGSDASGSQDGDVPAISIGSAPTTTLPSCPADRVDVPADWPFVVSDAVVPTSVTTTDLTYTLDGVVNDPETALVDALETSFPDFTASEPTGGASDVEVTFTSDGGEASFALADDDGDGCWTVSMSATYVDTPPPAPLPTAPIPSTTPVQQDDLTAVSVGQGEVATARGSFPFVVTRCDREPLHLEATAPEGTVLVVADGAKVSVVWTYADGVAIDDDDAIVMGYDGTTGTIVADGTGPNGDETVIVDFVCA